MSRKRAPRRAVAPEQAADAAAVGAGAVALLARRDYSAAGLRERLVSNGFEAATVRQVLEEFIARRYLDDERYAAQYVAYHAARGHGPRRIRRELTIEGVSEPLIAAALATIADWTALARELRIRRFGLRLPTSPQQQARQMRFLLYRGFSNDDIRSALGPDFPPPDETTED